MSITASMFNASAKHEQSNGTLQEIDDKGIAADLIGTSASTHKYVHTTTQPSNPFANLIDQTYCIIPSFQLESGVVLTDVPVAYKTFGKLLPSKDNVMIICHALTGNADIEDWWGPLIGPGRAFDTNRFFILCFNSLGSPYGSASPVTICPETGERYGPEFPLTTVRDDVKLHKLVLDDLDVRQVAVVVGGSMGGMSVLEWAYYGKDYVRAIVPLATSSRHSAWCISWGEAQRQSIYSDPKYADGYYPFDDPPISGLGAARMSALLTYRSRNSFESRFGRNAPDPSRQPYLHTRAPSNISEENWVVHNDGFKNAKKLSSQTTTPPRTADSQPSPTSSKFANESRLLSSAATQRATTYFSAQSYLRYQADKFVKRFDSNCYIAITRKLDTHDVSRNRAATVQDALNQIQQPTLVVGIESDGLFTYAEQQELAEHIPNAKLATIDSPEGHDAFLIQFEEVNKHVVDFLWEALPDIMSRAVEDAGVQGSAVGELKKSSQFGEAEVEDITAW